MRTFTFRRTLTSHPRSQVRLFSDMRTDPLCVRLAFMGIILFSFDVTAVVTTDGAIPQDLGDKDAMARAMYGDPASLLGEAGGELASCARCPVLHLAVIACMLSRCRG